MSFEAWNRAVRESGVRHARLGVFFALGCFLGIVGVLNQKQTNHLVRATLFSTAV
jgi:hypothetical protein